MVDDFPSNSHTARESKTAPLAHAKTQPAKEKVVKPVATGTVIRRKRPVGTRLKDFFVGMNARTAWRDVASGVVAPAIRDMMAHAGTTAWEQMIYGEARYRPRPNFRGPGPTRYDAMSRTAQQAPQGWSAARSDPRRDISPRARETHDFDEILMSSRGEAEAVIDQLIEIISNYQVATLADLYAMVGVSSAYTDQKYGWSNMQGASVQLVRGAYLLNLPKPELLD